MRNAKGFISVALSLVMLISLSLGALTMKACDNSDDVKFNRAVAALQAAPALIASFTNATPEEQARLTGYFNDAVSALKAYKQAKTDENWGAFVSVLATIAQHQLSDTVGAARINAIVGMVRIILGIPEEVLLAKGRGAVVTIQQPDFGKISDSDLTKLEELMKPLPRH